MSKKQTIELDCPPGNPRPGDLIQSVIDGTGLPHREAVSTFFGNWTWDYNDVNKELWDKVNHIIKERIVSLYNLGIIRYGSW